MSTRPQPPSEDRPVNNLGWGSDVAIQTYLDVVDDGKIAGHAATMAPKSKVYNARALVAQAKALQTEVTAELVRRREAIASSMSYATLLELARRLGIGDVGFLHITDEESWPNDPITGPVLRRLTELMRAMPPPQTFQDQFLADDPTVALELAASRTTLPRPLPLATFEEALRYAANIPEDEVTWDILNGAFLDFLRIWFQEALVMADLLDADAGSGLTKAESSKLLANLKRHQKDLACFHDTFTPGQQFPPEIDELAHRAYAECWEHGLLGPLWRRRLAWLVAEFTPFWHRHGATYLAIHQARVKTTAEAEAARAKAAAEAEAELRRAQNEISAMKRKAGEAGRQSREATRWRSVTANFIEFLKTNSADSAPASLQDCVATFVVSSPTLGGEQERASTLEFLQVLCVAASAEMDARSAFETLKRSQLTKIGALEPEFRKQRITKVMPNQMKQYRSKGTTPSTLVQFKSLTEEAVHDCLEDLKHALSKACVKKSKK